MAWTTSHPSKPWRAGTQSEIAPETTRAVKPILMLSGLIGGLIVTIMMAMARGLGLLSLNIETLWGSLVMGHSGSAAWMLGFVIHLALSAGIALIYGAAFRKVGDAGPSIGAAFGVVHWAVSSLLLGLIPLAHPRTPESFQAPGFFAVQTGLFGFFFIFLLHLIYGAIVGGYARDARLLPKDQIRVTSSD